MQAKTTRKLRKHTVRPTIAINPSSSTIANPTKKTPNAQIEFVTGKGTIIANEAKNTATPKNRSQTPFVRYSLRGRIIFSNFARNFGIADHIFVAFPPLITFFRNIQPGIQGVRFPKTICPASTHCTNPNGNVKPGGVNGNAVGKGEIVKIKPKLFASILSSSSPIEKSSPASSKTRTNCCESVTGLKRNGADSRIRTGDLLFTKQLLYH